MFREYYVKEYQLKDIGIQLSLPPEEKQKNQGYKGNLEHAEILYIILPYGILNIMLYKATELSHAKKWRVWAYISENYHLSYKENRMFSNSPKDLN